MSYKINNAAILIAMSVIALALVTTTSFNHYYTAFAVSKKSRSTGSDTNGVSTLGGISPSSSSATTPNSNTLTKKELSSLISCINTANKSGEGLTHKVVTNCLDTARGITSATASSTTTSSSSPSIAPSATSKS
jgi:hypothetical protein